MAGRTAGASAPRLEQRLAALHRPDLIVLMRVLPLAEREIADLVETALRDNPMLARTPGGPCAGCGRHCRDGLCRDCATAPVDAVAAAPVDWRSELGAQARLELDARDHAALAWVLGSLDEHGLLAEDVRGEAVARAITALRRVGPPGIAASSRLECLRLQVADAVARGRCPPLLVPLVHDHLEEVARGDLTAAATALGVPVPAVADAVGHLRTCVRPFVALSADLPRPPAPDVVFRRDPDEPGRLVAEVPDLPWYGLALDDRLWREAGRTGQAWLRPHRRQAQRLMAALGARCAVLQALASVLAVAQQDFLVRGPSWHRSLTRHRVAAVLGVHPSTVGRAVAGKTARCPDGRLIALADCFGGRTAALAAVAQALRDHPGASDAAIAQVAAVAGFRLSRRTVALYRGLLGIPAR